MYLSQLFLCPVKLTHPILPLKLGLMNSSEMTDITSQFMKNYTGHKMNSSTQIERYSSMMKWHPFDTRIFDVHRNGNPNYTSPTIDIFAKQFDLKADPTKKLDTTTPSDRDETSEFTKPNKNTFAANTRLDSTSSQGFSEIENPFVLNLRTPNLQHESTSSLINPHSTPKCDGRIADGKNGTICVLKDTYDKWSSEVENIFVDSLRVILKNGTSKIKINERNYGRNELISLYILYHTNEFRTKKQISSHIQVWKKTIQNKLENKIGLNPLEKEIHDLIDNGPPKTDAVTDIFFEKFAEIISFLEKRSRTRANSFRDKPGNEEVISGNADTKHLNLNVSSLVPSQSKRLIPENTRTTNLSRYTVEPPLIPPLQYARSLYEKIPDYRCIPVMIRSDSLYVPYTEQDLEERDLLIKTKNTERKSLEDLASQATKERALDVAKKKAAEQRRLIDRMYNRARPSHKGKVIKKQLYSNTLKHPSSRKNSAAKGQLTKHFNHTRIYENIDDGQPDFASMSDKKEYHASHATGQHNLITQPMVPQYPIYRQRSPQQHQRQQNQRHFSSPKYYEELHYNSKPSQQQPMSQQNIYQYQSHVYVPSNSHSPRVTKENVNPHER
ncbi:Tec1p KNAG_0J02360 [Huiozyma naganishii CBS 8797]|uniref:TEA domain-containing protein n=1 Tax=Huiozyma naganishii (strain ATCC MYA-139 / BCRC 22969 / CBS 8797 / KCTC 17520 / NBRC 10181 / NCYC 3082 / Yp74L-3) TaxID=1071383 RepID=J7SAN0_HUIN7|nr:hypothetical protein KNAG_0J02360 [Kazachstania naganishii CBS 8797]CCK72316.1 hypothetical protein KNAG_0J02360 [Kazachstania naganishii CBS 8797]